MDIFQGVFDRISPSTLSLLIVTGSLVLVVLIGGVVSLRRHYGSPAPRRAEETAARPADAAPSQNAIEPAIEAYHGRTEDEEIGEWEDELNKKLNELENRFAVLAHRLIRIGALDEEGAEVVRVLSERGMRREDLLPKVAELKGQGMQTAAIARQLSLSEEQMKLVQRLAAKQQSERAVGA